MLTVAELQVLSSIPISSPFLKWSFVVSFDLTTSVRLQLFQTSLESLFEYLLVGIGDPMFNFDFCSHESNLTVNFSFFSLL